MQKWGNYHENAKYNALQDETIIGHASRQLAIIQVKSYRLVLVELTENYFEI